MCVCGFGLLWRIWKGKGVVEVGVEGLFYNDADLCRKKNDQLDIIGILGTLLFHSHSHHEPLIVPTFSR